MNEWGVKVGIIRRRTLCSVCEVVLESYYQIFLHETESTGHLNNILCTIL